MNPSVPLRTLPAILCCAVGVCALGATLLSSTDSASGQAKTIKPPKLPTSLVIYRGDSLQTTGMTISNWGSGTVGEDTGKAFSGTESLKITTHGMYQGANLVFSKPFNLGPYLSGKYNYLTVALLIPAPTTSGSTGSDNNFAGLPGRGGPGGLPGIGGGGQSIPGQGSGRQPGGYGGAGGQIATQKNRKLENLRMVMVTSAGKTIELMLPLASATDQTEWKIVAVPLSAIQNLTADDAMISSVRLFGDAPSTLNVGSIGVTEDPNPIMLEPINDKTVQRLSKYQYYATASAGITPLVYSWDWDASDGIQDETHGRNITHAFRKASSDESGRTTDYMVTVSVSDLYHIKAPVKTSFKVHVTP